MNVDTSALCERLRKAWQSGPAQGHSADDRMLCKEAEEALRALAAERDAARHRLSEMRETSLNFQIDRDRLAAENARMRELLARADEELRLIRMKDTSALYDIGLRAALSAALAQEPRHD